MRNYTIPAWCNYKRTIVILPRVSYANIHFSTCATKLIFISVTEVVALICRPIRERSKCFWRGTSSSVVLLAVDYRTVPQSR